MLRPGGEQSGAASKHERDGAEHLGAVSEGACHDLDVVGRRADRVEAQRLGEWLEQ